MGEKQQMIKAKEKKTVAKRFEIFLYLFDKQITGKLL